MSLGRYITSVLSLNWCQLHPRITDFFYRSVWNLAFTTPMTRGYRPLTSWHILSIPLTTGRGTSAETCGLDDVFPPDDLGSRPEALCKYICIYIYVLSLYELCYRSYIKRDCHSVLAKLHPITFYRGVRGTWSECHFVFSLVYQLCLALW